jgi:hypothetical protein
MTPGLDCARETVGRMKRVEIRTNADSVRMSIPPQEASCGGNSVTLGIGGPWIV